MPPTHISQSKIKPADRITAFTSYFFAALDQKILELQENDVDVIRLDKGSPDMPPADFIIESLIKAAQNPNKHGYMAYGGDQTFRQAVATYYHNRFGVKLDPKTEILGLIGAKEGIFNLTQALINPGDIVLVPDPGYPVYRNSALIAGGSIYTIPLMAQNHFLPDLESIPDEIADSAKLLWLNYPNNPTGAIATLDFLTYVVEFGYKHNLIIAYDAPYTEVCFDDFSAPSILQIPRAKDITIEFNSLSKTYNMAGWRVAMVVGNPQIIQYLYVFKSQVDSSCFAAILDAGVSALTGDQNWIKSRNLIYQNRRDIVVKTIKTAGLWVYKPAATIYVWAHIPNGYSNSLEFCTNLLNATGVSVVPGIIYGEHGEGFFRISLSTSTEQIEEAMHRFINWHTQVSKSTPDNLIDNLS
jgi:LL-diaminopimelate aminotransferase